MAQAATGALRYDITFHPDRGRFYLDASWKATHLEPPPLAVLRNARILAIDLNADHLAAWVLNPDGNPVGPAITIAFELAGRSATTRDGRLRAALAGLCHIAKANGCQSLALENLDFKDARDRGREARGRRPARGRRGRAFRALLAGISTAKFKDRVTQMAHNASLAVIAVDPAYTTKWGAQHWLAPLRYQFSAKVSGHHAAAVTIGRRALGQRARHKARCDSTPPEDGRKRATGRAVWPRSTPAGLTGLTNRKGADREAIGPPGRTRDKTRPADRASPPDQATQDRSGPPTGQDLLLASV